MKFKYGNFPSRVVCNISKKWRESSMYENSRVLDTLVFALHKCVQFIYNNTINLYFDRKKHKISVKIDEWDMYSTDHLIAHVIHPLLVKIKNDSSSYPVVKNEDVPKHLHCDDTRAKWDYVLDEMIYAFSQDLDEDGWVYFGDIDSTVIDDIHKHEKRKLNGRILFAKYYNSLWS